MITFITIALSALSGTIFYYWCARMVKRESVQAIIHRNQWLMYPNSICYWRAAMAVAAYILYFHMGSERGYENIAIPLFTFAAILDGVDGLVARNCKLVSRWGEWLDPMCDKLTYLPPLVGFAYKGLLSVNLIWVLVGIEIFGQFFARRVLKMLNTSGAANNFGKIKAIICFGLVIFCALLDGNSGSTWIINIGDEVLTACIVLAAASILFKFIPNRLYADLLSTLNFCCGVTALYLAYQHRFAWATSIIIVGQLFDLFDGRMAEQHGGTKYGPYLDDIADFVSFGLAPAYIMILSGGRWSIPFALLFFCGVAFRLIRFVVVDKKRTDIPKGVFNGLPSPAGALIVLGAALIVPPDYLWFVAAISVGLMVSHVRFSHFGRVILKEVPRPIFFVASAAMIVIIALLLKTKSVQMYGGLILASVCLYLFMGRKWLLKTPAS